MNIDNFYMEFYINMTIKITSQNKDGSYVMECFNCSQKESSTKFGYSINWNKFEVQTNHLNDNDLKIICLDCGHSYRRHSLGMAKYKHLDKVHLCTVIDGNYFSSRCGKLSGTVTTATHNLEEIVEIST